MGTTDSKELVKNDPRFDYNKDTEKQQDNKTNKQCYEEEEK